MLAGTCINEGIQHVELQDAARGLERAAEILVQVGLQGPEGIRKRRGDANTPPLVAFAAKSGNRELQNEIRALEAFLSGGQGTGITLRKDLWRNARKEFLRGLRAKDAGKDWINPLLANPQRSGNRYGNSI